ncbi:MAG: recombinase family protein [Bacilli bacterium]|nr:recombinase family protein [Bacilli bacterium]
MNILEKKDYNVAIYIRLSKEDEKDGKERDSESVANQRNLLVKFVKDNGYELVNIYIDDGFTGTNFERPQFKQMIKDIELGKINMVITKDLSRLGRDYITTGEYIEKWFPKHNVRYISLLDGVDTMFDTTNNEIAPFKAIINDMYSRDNSKKIKAALRTKQQEGKWVGGCAPFGYMVDPNDRNHLVINEKEAPIVKKIFSLALEGKSKNQIINILFDEKVPTPSMIRNVNRTCKYSELGYWNTTTIRSILSNELYTGDMVQNRRSRISYKVRNIVSNDKSEWIIVEDTHEPIISKEEFNEVQRIAKINTGLRYKKKIKGIFDGLIYCGECKSRMALQGGNKGHCHGHYYTICNTYKKYSKLKLCTSHSYNFEKLETKIIKQLKKIINDYIDERKTVNNLIKNKDKLNNTSDLSLNLIKIDKSLETKKRNLDKMYVDKLEGNIEEEQYSRIKNKLNNEIRELEKKKDNIIKNIYDNDLSNDNEKCITMVKDLLNMEKPSRDIVIRLIKKIELHQDKTIDIYFNFKKLNV